MFGAVSADFCWSDIFFVCSKLTKEAFRPCTRSVERKRLCEKVEAVLFAPLNRYGYYWLITRRYYVVKNAVSPQRHLAMIERVIGRLEELTTDDAAYVSPFIHRYSRRV